ncbi:hypothetical protein KSP39_PZI006430 [Platanthera zijinensis]|uniref:CBM-cenC domain-containing protein n=1 Tax=Platanthera zijinensis TaxID=2320716 RepID=A0AAP0G9D5_9ASPA
MEVISVGPWGFEEGTPFSHPINNGRIRKLVILHEGGLKSITVKQETTDTPYSKKVQSFNHQPSSVLIPQIEPANIIKTSDFSQGIGAYWTKRGDGCNLEVVSCSAADGFNHKHYVIVSKRRQTWNGMHQDITKEVCIDCIYEIVAYVSLMGGNGQEFEMNTTLEMEKMDGGIYYIHAGRYGYIDFV